MNVQIEGLFGDEDPYEEIVLEEEEDEEPSGEHQLMMMYPSSHSEEEDEEEGEAEMTARFLEEDNNDHDQPAQ